MTRAVSVLALILASGACGKGSALPGGPSAAPLIELRLVHDAPAPGLELTEFEGDTLYLDPRPLIADPDLRAVRPFVRNGQLLLDIRLTPEGAHRLFNATDQHIGKRLAFLLESRVRSVAKVRTAIGQTERAQAALDLPFAEVHRLAEVVRAHWPVKQ